MPGSSRRGGATSGTWPAMLRAASNYRSARMNATIAGRVGTLWRLEEASLRSVGHGVRAVGRPELVEQGGQMILSGALRDHQPLGDALVGEPRPDERQHLLLAGAQQVTRARLPRRWL